MDRLSVEGAVAALSLIEAVMAAFAATAPRAVAKMGGVEGLIARSRMTAIGPMPKFTVEEWSAMALEGKGVGYIRHEIGFFDVHSEVPDPLGIHRVFPCNMT
jgi:hypothetical protein